MDAFFYEQLLTTEVHNMLILKSLYIQIFSLYLVHGLRNVL